ncbi:MAG: VOC family protein [Pseudomonadota bacterium]
MKRFHVNIGTADLKRSVEFYTRLFAAEPTVLKNDYAKWMLDDPYVNFSVSKECCSKGIEHIGLQTETLEELEELRRRIDTASDKTIEEPDVQCCYARSTKTWVSDPDNVRWETFVTHEQVDAR